MTTHGVRQYALGIQETYGLVGGNCTKVVTGGPDGDLGRYRAVCGCVVVSLGVAIDSSTVPVMAYF